MILGGLEIILGKVILGKIFAGAVTKVAVGVATKALIVHDVIQVASALSDASDVVNAADTASTIASAADTASTASDVASTSGTVIAQQAGVGATALTMVHTAAVHVGTNKLVKEGAKAIGMDEEDAKLTAALVGGAIIIDAGLDALDRASPTPNDPATRDWVRERTYEGP
jgi:hypothetical protein